MWTGLRSRIPLGVQQYSATRRPPIQRTRRNWPGLLFAPFDYSVVNFIHWRNKVGERDGIRKINRSELLMLLSIWLDWISGCFYGKYSHFNFRIHNTLWWRLAHINTIQHFNDIAIYLPLFECAPINGPKRNEMKWINGWCMPKGSTSSMARDFLWHSKKVSKMTSSRSPSYSLGAHYSFGANEKGKSFKLCICGNTRSIRPHFLATSLCRKKAYPFSIIPVPALPGIE